MIRRRVLLAFAGVIAGSLSTRLARAADSAQRVVRLGIVSPDSHSTAGRLIVFFERLRERGWVEGQNLMIERRWAEGHFDQLPGLMAEVIG